jgi:hypothetical protein
MSAGQWVAAFMEPRLDRRVPERVAELVEAARGAMLYGWFFYPLYAVAEDQLFIAAEAALRAKYVAVTGTKVSQEKLPRFKRLRLWALKQGVIQEGDEIWWEATERLRNATAHTPIQRLGPPGAALQSLASTCARISALYREGDPNAGSAFGPTR